MTDTRPLDAETLLFTGQVQGLILSCFENERPLQGLAGKLDWRLRGMLSDFLRAGSITGKAGECCYVPVRWHERTLHLFLAGGGYLTEGMKRPELPPASWEKLKTNLKSLRVGSMAVSIADLGGIDAATVKARLTGLEVQVTA